MSVLSIAARVEGDVVTMRRAEFDRLLEMIEDAQDVLSADAIKRKLASGDEETVPAAFVDRMLAGESLVRLWREHRGMAEQELAARSGLPPAHLSEIEHGRREASLHELKRVATVLDVGLDDLVR